MASSFQSLKKRYADEIIRHINNNPQAFLDLDSPSERRGQYEKAKPAQAVRVGRFGPVPEPSETQRAFGAGLYDGLTFGVGDEIDAVIAATPALLDERDAGDAYDAELQRVRAEADYLQQQHPYAYGSGTVIGSLVQPANYTGLGWAGRGAGLLARVRRSAAAGAGNGAIQGFTRGAGGAANRIENAGKSAVVGAVAGAVLGVPIHGYKTGMEINFGPNFRIAPFGNRTGSHPLGKFPHYHRRGPIGPNGKTILGQGIGTHRPWEMKVDKGGRPLDKSLLGRF